MTIKDPIVLMAMYKLNIRELPGNTDNHNISRLKLIGLSFCDYLDLPFYEFSDQTHYLQRDDDDGDVVYIGTLEECKRFLTTSQIEIERKLALIGIIADNI